MAGIWLYGIISSEKRRAKLSQSHIVLLTSPPLRPLVLHASSPLHIAQSKAFSLPFLALENGETRSNRKRMRAPYIVLENTYSVIFCILLIRFHNALFIQYACWVSNFFYLLSLCSHFGGNLLRLRSCCAVKGTYQTHTPHEFAIPQPKLLQKWCTQWH